MFTAWSPRRSRYLSIINKFLRQQPVAGDLRKVSTALKMVTDIERIADQASDIAEITLHLHPDGARTVGVLDDLYAMGDIALHMVKDAIAAYVQVDLSTAAQVIARDDDCDAMFSRISKEIAVYIAAHPSERQLPVKGWPRRPPGRACPAPTGAFSFTVLPASRLPARTGR